MISFDALPPLLVWMIAAIAFGALVLTAAAGADRGMRLMRLPTRHVWTTAIAVATVWPLLAVLFLTRQVAPPVAGEVAMGAPLAVVAAPAAAPTTDWAALAGGAALLLWCALTAILLLRLVRVSLQLRRVQRASRATAIDGETVLVSDSVGPAAIGVRDPRIIVPAWTLELESGLRALVLRHEREHCRASDPAVLWGASLATALVPWNPALWYLARSLRLAMEMDCDARTLAALGTTAGDDARRRYARVLMLIAQRNTMTPHAPMLVHTPSQLARRISAMNAMPTRHPVLRALAAGAVALLAITAACSQRIANGLAGPDRPDATRAGESASVEATPTTAAPQEQPYFDFQVDKPVVMAPGSKGPRYPDELRAARVEGSVLAQFVVRPDGMAVPGTIKVLKTSHPSFSESVTEAITGMRFIAAEKSGRKVSQLVQQPFMFALSVEEKVQSLQDEIKTRYETQRAEALSSKDGAAAVSSGAALRDYQTEKPAVMVPGSKGPAYPASLIASKTEGTVLAAFVVGADGRVDMPTFNVIKSTHPLFSEAVKAALVEMTFAPAIVGGKPVRQLLEQPFQFSINR